MSQKILEIVIPTCGRPQAAIGAIESVLLCADSRVGIFCHSNGVEHALESAITRYAGVRYGHFPENMGMVANFRKVLVDSQAEYSLFLSDEDRISPQQLASFVDFLSTGKYSFVMCSVLESTGDNYFSVAALQGESLSFKDLMRLFLIDPTYLSGYCFRKDLLTDAALEAAFEVHDANVYPHVLLRNSVARCGGVGLFGPGLIKKGTEANTGGDSHAHIEKSPGHTGANATAVLPLNPKTYGEAARINQFYFMHSRLSHHLAMLPWPSRLYAKLYFLCAWLNIANNAYKHVSPSPAALTAIAAINEYRQKSAHEGYLVSAFNWIMSIRNTAFRGRIVSLLWNAVKSLKLAFFILRFGTRRTFNFLRTRRG